MMFRSLKTLCKQLFDGSKHYVSSVSMAEDIMSKTLRWLKILCKPGFDGSKY